MRSAARLLAGIALAAAAVTACSNVPSAADDRTGPIRVVAAVYPLAYLAEQIGGDEVDVITLASAGVEPHDLELTPTQVAQIADADLVLYAGGLQPAVDDAIALEAPDRGFDILTAVDARTTAGATDPHAWLDPANMATLGQRLAERLGARAPQAPARAEEFGARMADLRSQYAAGLADCRDRDLVVAHESFGYLADAFHLSQIGLSGLDPEAEPSPAHLAEVADLVRTGSITTIYVEPLLPAAAAETIAGETGASIAVLDPIEALVPGATADYETIMRANLQTLRAGQGCR